MSVEHKEDSIKERQEAERARQERQAAEEERDTMLLELDYKLMLLERFLKLGWYILFRQNKNRSNIYECQKRRCQLIIPSSDTSKVF